MSKNRAQLGPGPIDEHCERLVRELGAEVVVVVAGGCAAFGEKGGGYSVNARGPGKARTCEQLRKIVTALEDTARQIRAFEAGLRADG